MQKYKFFLVQAILLMGLLSALFLGASIFWQIPLKKVGRYILTVGISYFLARCIDEYKKRH